MEFRRLTEQDRDQYGRLCRYAFGTSLNHYNQLRYPDAATPTDWLYGIFLEDTLICGATLIDFEMLVRNSWLKMGGLAAVASKPEYRNLGAVRLLTLALFEQMHRTGKVISHLYPFKFSYWEKFGYRQAEEHEISQFLIESIRFLPVPQRRIVEVYSITDEIKRVYAACSQRYNLSVKRYDRRWAIYQEENYKFLCLDENQEPVGYLFMSFPGDKAPPWFRTMKDPADSIIVMEAYWQDQATKQAIFNFLWSHRDQRKSVTLWLPRQELVIDMLTNPSMLNRHVRNNSMSRIIDLAPLLAMIRYPHKDFEFTLRVRDELCAWNRGDFRVQSASGTVTVTAEVISAPDLTIGISELSQVIAGFRTIDDLLTLQTVAVTDSARKLLTDLFPRGNNFLHDFF